MAEGSSHRTTRLVAAASTLVSVVALCAVGVGLDGDPDVTQPDLFWAFLAASVCGTVIGLVGSFEPERPLWGHLALACAAAALWRLSYFPHLVFGGFVAAVSEAALEAFGVEAPPIYPVFLPAIVALHAVSFLALSRAFARRPGDASAPTLVQKQLRDNGPSCGGVMVRRCGFWLMKAGQRPVETARSRRCVPGGPTTMGVIFSTASQRLTHPPRSLVAIGAAPAIAVAALVSISTPADVTLLPDAPWEAPRALPPAGAPGDNPYIDGVLDGDRPIPPRVLRLAAAMTYVFIPHSPWAKDVKGTLSALTSRYPQASTRQRLDEHYVAYLVAHEKLGGGSR